MLSSPPFCHLLPCIPCPITLRCSLYKPALALHPRLPPRRPAARLGRDELVPERLPLYEEAVDERPDELRREGEAARSGEGFDVDERGGGEVEQLKGGGP